MANSKIAIPNFEFQSNLVVFPLKNEDYKVTTLTYGISIKQMYMQGSSYLYVLKNNDVDPVPTGSCRYVQYRPDHVYCLVPSYEVDKGEVVVYEEDPPFISAFPVSLYIKQVRISNTLFNSVIKN